MAILATDIVDFLAGLGLIDGATGWTSAKEYMPPSPDKIIAVFETPGLEPEIVSEGVTETAYDQPGFQIRARGAAHGYAAMRDKLTAIFAALHGVSITGTTNNAGYLLVRAVQSAPMNLGHDEKSRPEATWNFLTVRER